MTAIDDLIRKYAREADNAVDASTTVPYYTFVGVLAEFLLEATPLIEAAVRADIEAKGPVETPEAAAERFVKEHPDSKIQAIKAYRDWAIEHGHPYSLKEAKDAVEDAQRRLGVPVPTYRVRSHSEAVKSFTDNDKTYWIGYDLWSDGSRNNWHCTCPAYTHGKGAYGSYERHCKHIVYVKSEYDYS